MPDKTSLKPAELDNTPWDHKWGFADTEFVVHEDRTVELTGKRYNLSGYRMPDLIPYVEEVLGIQLDITDQKSELQHKPVASPIRNTDFCAAVEKAFKPTQYNLEDEDRLLHSH